MSNWAKVILEEYPNFNIVGEIWTGEPAFLAGFQANSKVKDFNTHLPSVIDFGMRDSFARYLKDERGLYDIYNTLAKDLLYSNPQNLMPFIDNHDVDRGMYLADGDYEKFKIALTILLTTRGIPQIFYGTEIGINEGDGHGKIRKPFPGGFIGDERNAFTKEERTEIENNIFNHLKKLIELRKVYKPLATGKLTHFYPVDETYVYFKENEDQKFMIVINNNEEEFEVNLSRMESELNNADQLIDLFNDEIIDYTNEKNLILSPKTSKIYLLN
ncbi:MAG: cyclomaltodextrinase C-terminal domain-containing protein [Melioribacteraceae bacterium]|nr:cyclomaltodextrinase C-terminal domain-containing protein [Melioribacteraceae bacterium]